MYMYLFFNSKELPLFKGIHSLNWQLLEFKEFKCHHFSFNIYIFGLLIQLEICDWPERKLTLTGINGQVQSIKSVSQITGTHL